MDDEFCPDCDANIGEGTYGAIGCPICGSQPEDDNGCPYGSDAECEEE
jgi:hypothetical protein